MIRDASVAVFDVHPDLTEDPQEWWQLAIALGVFTRHAHIACGDMMGGYDEYMSEYDIDFAVRIPSVGRWPDDVALWCVDMRAVADHEDTIYLT